MAVSLLLGMSYDTCGSSCSTCSLVTKKVPLRLPKSWQLSSHEPFSHCSAPEFWADSIVHATYFTKQGVMPGVRMSKWSALMCCDGSEMPGMGGVGTLRFVERQKRRTMMVAKACVPVLRSLLFVVKVFKDTTYNVVPCPEICAGTRTHGV